MCVAHSLSCGYKMWVPIRWQPPLKAAEVQILPVYISKLDQGKQHTISDVHMPGI